MNSKKGHYEILGLDPSAPPSQIERAYRFVKGIYDDPALGAQLGPVPAELMRQRARIDEAYRVLNDPLLRKGYDEARGVASPTTAHVPAEEHSNRRGRRERDRGHAAATEPPHTAASKPKGPVPPPVGPFNGKVLRAYRLARGVSLEQIAAETKIRTHYLEKLEADHFDAFPAALYLKGYLQAYCRVLGLDADEVVPSYISRVTFQAPAIRLPSLR